MAFRIRGAGGLLLPEEAAPATPASGEGRVYVDTSGILRFINDAGVNYDLTATGGGGGSNPALGTNFHNSGRSLLAPASRGTQAANGQYWVPIVIPVPTTITGIRYRKGAGTTAANVITSLYDATGARVAVSGTTAQGVVAGVHINVPFTAAYAAAAGLYWASYMGSAAAADWWGHLAAEYMGPSHYAAQGTFAAAASFTPPAATTQPVGTAVPLLMTY